MPIFALANAVVAQLVEHQLPKLRVTGSSPAYRSLSRWPKGSEEPLGLFLCL